MPHEFGPRRAGGRAGPCVRGTHTLGTRAGRHSRTAVWLVMEEGLCESNSFLGHCCHRGEHFNPLPKREGGDRGAEGAERGARGAGARSLVNSSRPSPQPARACVRERWRCSAFRTSSFTSLLNLEIRAVSPGGKVGFCIIPFTVPVLTLARHYCS